MTDSVSAGDSASSNRAPHASSPNADLSNDASAKESGSGDRDTPANASEEAQAEEVPSADVPSVEETLDRMQRTLRRINVGMPEDPDENMEDDDGSDGSTEKDIQQASSDRGGDGLARLVLTLVQLLHDVLERQAIRRMEADTLTPDEVERIGQALMKQAEEIKRICDAFGIDPEDLDIDLGTVHVDNAS